MTRFLAFLPFTAALLLGAAANAQDPAPEEYARCMRLARTQPAEGFETASGWAARGGGLHARHCAAVALLSLGQSAEAASRLEALATANRGEGPRFRVELLSQAAQGWLAARMPERAHAALTAAIRIAGGDADLWIDRSIVLASARNYWEAIDDLNRAIELAPRRADALVLRATAYRYVDSLELAEEDLTRALTLDPRSVDALLERGILRRLRNDVAGARRDWMEVLRLQPEGAAADGARANIEKLDVRTDR
ncbi:MAG: tetratricopeptide repeat protein [Alphaproteobacteria bacterium]